MSMLMGISNKSWHYRYYVVLHRIYSIYLPKNTSLCRYAWFLAFFSFLSAVLALPAAIGWIFLKFARILYTVLEKYVIGEKVLDWLDKKLYYGKALENSETNIDNYPMLFPVFICFATIFTVALISIIFSICTIGIWAVIQNFFKIPSLIWTCILYIGWAFSWAFCAIGALLLLLADFCVWLWKWVCIIFLYCLPFVPVVIKWLAIIAGSMGITFLIGYLIVKFFDTEIGKRFTVFLSLKFNGFQKARKETLERREVAKQQAEIKKESLPPSKFSIFTDKIIDKLISLKEKLFTGRKKVYKGREFNVLGFLPMIWQFIKSTKDGVCPFLEIIDEETEEDKKKMINKLTKKESSCWDD